jgi:hypothetical protein
MSITPVYLESKKLDYHYYAGYYEREFHSIELAQWLHRQHLSFVLRQKGNTTFREKRQPFPSRDTIQGATSAPEPLQANVFKRSTSLKKFCLLTK